MSGAFPFVNPLLVCAGVDNLAPEAQRFATVRAMALLFVRRGLGGVVHGRFLSTGWCAVTPTGPRLPNWLYFGRARPDQTQKADRVKHLQRCSTRSAYSSTGSRRQAIAVRLVCRISATKNDDTLSVLACKRFVESEFVAGDGPTGVHSDRSALADAVHSGPSFFADFTIRDTATASRRSSGAGASNFCNRSVGVAKSSYAAVVRVRHSPALRR